MTAFTPMYVLEILFLLNIKLKKNYTCCYNHYRIMYKSCWDQIDDGMTLFHFYAVFIAGGFGIHLFSTSFKVLVWRSWNISDSQLLNWDALVIELCFKTVRFREVDNWQWKKNTKDLIFTSESKNLNSWVFFFINI